MLKLINIKKDYVTKGVPTVHALKGLTVNFRRNEFVAILGASGCGKTTLLNIIGGLDRYTSGDLLIEGRSTKDYTDRDWDTYRNHSIGFVFQSYNLIAHQTVLGNVELALTISGIKKEDRRARALKALETVGLQGMEKKKPNQLSGGQMQRVAIARALVNDPEILLADEPTGALDSETSIQIMDLLKEVASDRLVIMVTHNPELAEKYANRIITMKDGLITGDQNPYEGETKEELEVAKQHKNTDKGRKEKTSMSFPTATGLSFFNLLSKLKRTILISVAGSIGIIGVSSVLAVSNGVNVYVHHMQDDMLSRYPLEISETAVDYSALMSGLASMSEKELSEFDPTTEVGLDSMISYLISKYSDFTKVKTNDINDDLIYYIENMPDGNKYIDSINKIYGLDLTNNIFTTFKRDGNTPDKYMSLNGLTMMYTSELSTVEGFGEFSMFFDLFTDFMKQIPGEKDYILSQYDLIGENSKYPESANEIVLVVDENQTLTDLVYGQLGFYTEEDFLKISKKAIKIQEINDNESLSDEQKKEKIKALDNDPTYQYKTSFKIDDLINKKLLYQKQDDMWSYREMTNQILTFDELTYGYDEEGNPDPYNPRPFSGTLIYNEYTQTLEVEELNLNGVSIPSNLVTIKRAEGSTTSDTNPFVGKWDLTMSYGDYSISYLCVVGNETDDTYFDVQMFYPDYSAYVSVLVPTSPRECTQSEEITQSGYMYDATPDVSKCEEVTISGILKKKKNIQFGCLDRGVYYNNKMAKKYMDDSINSVISKDLQNYLNDAKKRENLYKAYVTYTYTSFIDPDHPQYDIPGVSKALNTDLSSSLASMISITGTSNVDVNRAYLRSICGLASKLNEDGKTYSFDDVPQTINIYPKNFSAKKSVTKYLDRWNSDDVLTLNGHTSHLEDRQELTYTDTIEMIINVINSLITTITIALVAFTSLSLVVSCFMIAVITYISTMERVKEIGVIRSLGGRKKDVSRLFIAECLIIGLASGIIGILVTYGLSGIFNLAIMSLKVGNIANLPIWTAAIMVGISVLLNVLSGLIPAMRASSQDPVVALRTE